MKRVLVFALLLCAVFSASAQLRLPQIIGSDMVLQQQADVTLWGWAAPGARITLTASWDDSPVKVRVGADGAWKLRVRTPKASNEPQWLAFSDGQERRTLNNVLIGEVWFCSGQSNMEMPLRGFGSETVEGADADIARSGDYPGIRMAHIPHTKASEPQAETPGSWVCSSPQTAAGFSATAYYFARELNRTLDIPVGIIHCSWGGTKVEGWMPRELLEKYGDVDLADATSATCHDMSRPMVMYNAMLHPLQNYTIRGFLWYQGCSNVGAHATYAQRQTDMVALWREKWGLGKLPFYFVEIAPFDYGEGDKAPYLREAQHRAAELIPNSGIVSTSDLVYARELACIHPSRKCEVGERLANMALNRTYGFSDRDCLSPQFREITLGEDGSAVLSFRNAAEGFRSPEGFPGFEAAGADCVFHPAQAAPVGGDGRLRVWLPDGTPVVAVRYCFHNWAPSAVWNLRGLPLMPFRTDDWQ